MNDFYQMDVFFFVTSIAVVLIAVILAIALIYLIRILRDIKHISKKAKAGADILGDELEGLRANVKEQGFRLRHFFRFLKNVYKKNK